MGAEDSAYSLFDVLEVYPPLIYGEGPTYSFRRLMNKVHAREIRRVAGEKQDALNVSS